MMRGLVTVLISAIVIGLSGAAEAANVTSFQPDSLVRALQNAGYKAILKKSSEGDPFVETASDGVDIRIVMTDCQNHGSCSTTEFVGLWDCTKSVDTCAKAASDTNNEESPMHVVITDKGATAATYMYLLYDEVGISEELFIRNFITFNYYNNQFATKVLKK